MIPKQEDQDRQSSSLCREGRRKEKKSHASSIAKRSEKGGVLVMKIVIGQMSRSTVGPWSAISSIVHSSVDSTANRTTNTVAES